MWLTLDAILSRSFRALMLMPGQVLFPPISVTTLNMFHRREVSLLVEVEGVPRHEFQTKGRDWVEVWKANFISST